MKIQSEVKTIPKNNSTNLNIDRFAGVDTRTACTLPSGSADILNMVPLSDGSLKKRCGYKKLFSLPAPPKAIWTGRLGGNDIAFIVADRTLYTFDFSTNSITRTQNVGSQSPNADFFCYNGGIYLLEGTKIYEISHGDLRLPYGYVPLVGKNWSDSLIGEINEPRNLLNNYGRITYIVSDNATNFFKTDSPISAIHAVFVNDIKIDSTRYTITAMPRTVSISGLYPGDRVEMHFTYTSTADRQAYNSLLSCTSGVVFGGITNTRPFLWGSDDSSLMFSSRFVSKAQLEESKKVFTASDTMYFPVNCEFKAGDGRSPITAVSRHYDRLLIFTEENAWMADSSTCDTEDIPTLNINSCYGARAPKGAALLGNNPYTISAEGIIQWSSNTDELNDCNASSISESIAELLPSDVYTSGIIFADRHKNRLLLTSPSLEGIVWVWYAEPQAWVRFDLGMKIDRFFDTPSGVGFAHGSDLYAFDDDLYVDHEDREIIGKFKGNFTDFGKYGKKRVFSASISCDGEVTLDCELDSDLSPTISLTLSSDGHESTRRRISARRFDRLRPTLTASGNGRQTIHSLKLFAD